MSILTVSTPFNIDLEFAIAPFHKRLLAWLLDTAIVFSLLILFFHIAMGVSPFDSRSTKQIFVTAAAFSYVSYHFLMETFCNGQSVGKLALGIKVFDKSGKEPTVGQYLIRSLLRIADTGGSFYLGGILSVALTPYTQRLGDLAAGTVVIDKRSRTDIQETIYLEIDETHYQPLFPQVMRLTDRDINGIRNLLQTKNKTKETYRYMTRIADKIKDVLKLETDLEPEDLLEQLLRDYNFLTRK